MTKTYAVFFGRFLHDSVLQAAYMLNTQEEILQICLGMRIVVVREHF